MTPLSDRVVTHLRSVAELPDLTGTKYRIIETIARGGMGTVYLAEDTALDRSVALKVLNDPDPSGLLAAQMLTEARIVARLEHPSIVPIHDVGTLPDGRVFYVMKYVQGSRLDRFVDGPASRSTLLRIFQRICEAVAFAHSHGVLHCDLKPENIMVGAFGEALVMDWGIARVRHVPEDMSPGPDLASGEETPSISNNSLRSRSGALMGTPAYMATEQIDDPPRPLDERTDVHALGAILYVLLTGRPPYGATTFREMRSILAGPALAGPRTIAPDIPRALDAICLKAMARQPEARYPRVADLADDIARFLDDLPVSAYREPFIERAMRWLARYRFIVFLIVGYLLMRLIVLLASSR